MNDLEKFDAFLTFLEKEKGYGEYRNNKLRSLYLEFLVKDKEAEQ